MLSILIPVYNFDVRKLVQVLVRQADALGIVYEVRLYDDGSTRAFDRLHQNLIQSPKVLFKKMPQNLGRARIRNLLAKEAKYEQLLFLDCDSAILKPDFLENYITRVSSRKIICGGRVYSQSPPADDSRYFHWYYGVHRESIPVTQRSKQPYDSFMTNNFCVSRKVVLQHPFEANLSQYGHEDTLFGLVMKQENIPIEHIENPVVHLGLESFDTFIQKTGKAIENLCYLYNNYGFDNTKLLKAYLRLRQFNLSKLSRMVLARLQGWFLVRLQRKSPRLVYFDLYKLSLLFEIMEAAQKRPR